MRRPVPSSVAVLVVALAASAGCRRTPGAASGALDAGSTDGSSNDARAVIVDAGPPDRTMRVVARAPWAPFDVGASDDGRLFFPSGGLVYEARADGALDLVGGNPGIYAPVVSPNGDEALVGYLDLPRIARVVPNGSGVDVRFATVDGGGFRIEGGALKLLDAAAAPPPYTGASQDLPSRPPGEERCARVRSFDGRTYARCHAPKMAGGTLYVLDGGTWSKTFGAASGYGRGSVSSDGALYALAPNGREAVRCAPGGPCTPLTVEPHDDVRGPSYGSSVTEVVREDGQPWQTLLLRHDARASHERVHFGEVIARSPDDVWIVGSDPGGRVVFHSGPRRAVQELPSEIDARVLVQNAKPPVLWVGHCEQVFVRLAGTRELDAGAAADASTPASAVKARLPQIKKALARAPSAAAGIEPFAWTLVEGRLHDEHVAAVVVFRSDVEAKLEHLERAVTKLVDELASNPMDRPRVTCTLPVLSAIHADARE